MAYTNIVALICLVDIRLLICLMRVFNSTKLPIEIFDEKKTILIVYLFMDCMYGYFWQSYEMLMVV